MRVWTEFMVQDWVQSQVHVNLVLNL